MKSFLKFFGFVLFSTMLAQASFAREVVVLVPGFFNSFAPEYFSQDIINSFKSKGFQVYVTGQLDPIGHINENGARLEKYLGEIEKLEKGHVAFNLVGHSAGGFYAMWVANRRTFEIKNILAVATPFNGVDFIDEWRRDSAAFRSLLKLAHLESLSELTPAGAKAFIQTIRLDAKTKVFAYGGYQSSGWDLADARNLSIPMRVTDHFTIGASDGIVSFKSATGVSGLRTIDGLIAQQYKDENFRINLEHWEQVLDARSFVLLGVLNTGYIRNEQIRFYTGLAQFLQTQQ